MKPFLHSVCVLALLAGHTQAEPEKNDPEKARALFKEGRELVAAGKNSEACPKFEASLEYDVGLGTQFNLATCYESIGRTASAWVLFVNVADGARASKQADRERVARERARALEPKLSKLSIDVKTAPTGLRILRDGKELPSNEWNAMLPVDPGKHDVSAVAPEKKPWSTSVLVDEPGRETSILVPDLEDAKKAPPVAAAPVAKKKPVAEAKPKEEPKHRPLPPDTTTHDILTYVFLGGFGVGAVVSGVSLGLYRLHNDEAESICPSSQNCTPSQIADHSQRVDSATSARTFAYVGFGIAGASLLGLGVTTLLRPTGREMTEPSAFRAAPIIAGDGSFGAELGGSF